MWGRWKGQVGEVGELKKGGSERGLCMGIIVTTLERGVDFQTASWISCDSFCQFNGFLILSPLTFFTTMLDGATSIFINTIICR